MFDIFNFDFAETCKQMEMLIQLFTFEVRGMSSQKFLYESQLVYLNYTSEAEATCSVTVIQPGR